MDIKGLEQFRPQTQGQPLDVEGIYGFLSSLPMPTAMRKPMKAAQDKYRSQDKGARHSGNIEQFLPEGLDREKYSVMSGYPTYDMAYQPKYTRFGFERGGGTSVAPEMYTKPNRIHGAGGLAKNLVHEGYHKGSDTPKARERQTQYTDYLKKIKRYKEFGDKAEQEYGLDRKKDANYKKLGPYWSDNELFARMAEDYFQNNDQDRGYLNRPFGKIPLQKEFVRSEIGRRQDKAVGQDDYDYQTDPMGSPEEVFRSLMGREIPDDIQTHRQPLMEKIKLRKTL